VNNAKILQVYNIAEIDLVICFYCRIIREYSFLKIYMWLCVTALFLENEQVLNTWWFSCTNAASWMIGHFQTSPLDEK
jgi:hypothetical protein